MTLQWTTTSLARSVGASPLNAATLGGARKGQEEPTAWKNF